MVVEDLAARVSTLVSVLQALGAVVVLYLIFGIINTWINRNRLKEIKEMSKDIKSIKNSLSKKK